MNEHSEQHFSEKRHSQEERGRGGSAWGNEDVVWGGRERGGGRVRRGEARFLLLDALRDSPKHGYEVIRTLDERSSGQYVPSPGMVYPTLQFLEEMGLVTSDQSGERRVYSLTAKGNAELEAHAAELEAFWKQVTGPAISAAGQSEIRFLREEMENLRRTIRGGLRPVVAREELETVRAVRQAVERCRNEVRKIITEAESKRDISL